MTKECCLVASLSRHVFSPVYCLFNTMFTNYVNSIYYCVIMMMGNSPVRHHVATKPVKVFLMITAIFNNAPITWPRPGNKVNSDEIIEITLYFDVTQSVLLWLSHLHAVPNKKVQKKNVQKQAADAEMCYVTSEKRLTIVTSHSKSFSRHLGPRFFFQSTYTLVYTLGTRGNLNKK